MSLNPQAPNYFVLVALLCLNTLLKSPPPWAFIFVLHCTPGRPSLTFFDDFGKFSPHSLILETLNSSALTCLRPILWPKPQQLNTTRHSSPLPSHTHGNILDFIIAPFTLHTLSSSNVSADISDHLFFDIDISDFFFISFFST